MKILLFGKNGQVGRELQGFLTPLGTVISHNSRTANFESSQKLQKIISEIKPHIIVNAAAYTAVDKAESEFEKARQINARAVKTLAIEAKKQGAWFIHYSTDYVFDGEKTEPYTETDSTKPLNAYGKTKLLGEEAIQGVNGKYLILRISGIYSPHGSNFPKTILRLSKNRNEIKVVSDQFSTPTSAEFVASSTATVLGRIQSLDSEQIRGIYHLTPLGKVSWFDFARQIVVVGNNKGALQLKPESVNPIESSQYPSPTRRPRDSRLDSTKISKTFGIDLPSWKTLFQEMVNKGILEKLKRQDDL